MIVTIQPSPVSGTIQSPASKSSMQRACAAALLYKGTTVIKNPGDSNDDRAAISVIKGLGAKVIEMAGQLSVTSDGVNPVSDEINCGESGLGIRMFSPIAALSEKPITISGSGSLVSRPMDFFDQIFPLLKVGIQSNGGRLPLKIQGPLQPAEIEVDGSLSSQFLTGLLMAYGAAGAANLSIRVRNLTSKPYIDLTLQVMKKFGVEVENRNYEEFYFPSSTRDADSGVKEYTVEGDWSGGAFLLVAGAIAGNIVVKGLDVHSTQADKAILQALANAGASLSVQHDQIVVGPAGLRAFQFDATECPDLFPPLVALASYCEGKTVIRGANRLTHKESNRALTLQQEFGKMGVTIELQDDLMTITGASKLRPARVHSRHDHRIAMACAVAALRAEGAVVIEEADAINKSYPAFYEDLVKLGAKVYY
jgi:3-phosphoshikimate 1-carboxyvinyltransferase